MEQQQTQTSTGFEMDEYSKRSSFFDLVFGVESSQNSSWNLVEHNMASKIRLVFVMIKYRKVGFVQLRECVHP